MLTVAMFTQTAILPLTRYFLPLTSDSAPSHRRRPDSVSLPRRPLDAHSHHNKHRERLTPEIQTSKWVPLPSGRKAQIARSGEWSKWTCQLGARRCSFLSAGGARAFLARLTDPLRFRCRPSYLSVLQPYSAGGRRTKVSGFPCGNWRTVTRKLQRVRSATSYRR
jgi:hypothetical protein